MWAWDPSKEGIARGRKEEELARYFKLEYGEAEVERLLAQARDAGRSSHGRFLRRLRHIVTRRRGYGRRGSRIADHAPTSRSPRTGASASNSPNEIPSARDPAPQELPVECRHAEWEPLGSGGNATYFQCRACGALMVNQSGRLWSFALDRPGAI